VQGVTNVKRQELIDALMFCLLITLGIYSRFAFLEWPNFTAVGAVALFAGYYFGRLVMAAMVPMAVMFISNQHESLQGYLWYGDTLAVYGALLIPVVIGHTLQKRLSPGRIAKAVLAPAICFFLLTNFSSWIIMSSSAMPMYDRTAAGLVECYMMALPFFRDKLTGDVLFAGLLFGSHALAVSYGWLPRRQLAYEAVR
jgi:hypothetical protein